MLGIINNIDEYDLWKIMPEFGNMIEEKYRDGYYSSNKVENIVSVGGRKNESNILG